VTGNRREGGAVHPYSLASRAFKVSRWSGITVGDARLARGRRPSFRLGPRSVRVAKGDSKLPTVTSQIGPIDYPDTYSSPVRFIDKTHSFVRDPKNPSDIEWYCIACSFRPWADSANAKAVAVEMAAPDGGLARVAAKRSGDRWVATRALPRGGSAYGPACCARDAWSDLNGAASTRLGRGKAKRRTCASAKPRTLRCSRASGRLGGNHIGPLQLGRSRGGNRAALFTLTAHTKAVDRFCVSGGGRERVVYSRGKAIAVATTSRRYSALGRSPGARAAGLGSRSVKAGGRRWVLRAGRTATVAFMVRRGRIAQVGLVTRGLSPTMLRRALRGLR
jgi:hypothetical protein